MKTKYIEIRNISEWYPRRKTKTFLIVKASKERDSDIERDLGIIKWDSGWRQYVFEPKYLTKWSYDCLDAITDKIKKLMRERNRSR